MKFLLAYKEGDDEVYQPDDLVGFSSDSLDGDYPSLVTNLKEQGKISKRTFAFYLSDNDWDDE